VRIAFDTNVLVRAVATRGLCADLFSLVLARHELIVGETVISELRHVLGEKFGVPSRTIDEVVALLRQEGLVVKNAPSVRVRIRDKDDLPVLSEAIEGKADVLVTGDKDLLELTAKLPLKILSPRGMWERFRENNAPTD